MLTGACSDGDDLTLPGPQLVMHGLLELKRGPIAAGPPFGALAPLAAIKLAGELAGLILPYGGGAPAPCIRPK